MGRSDSFYQFRRFFAAAGQIIFTITGIFQRDSQAQRFSLWDQFVDCLVEYPFPAPVSSVGMDYFRAQDVRELHPFRKFRALILASQVHVSS